MRELSKAMQGMKSPFFEAVILSEVNGNNPIQGRLAAIRPFSPQFLDKQQTSAQAAPAVKQSPPLLSSTK
jgi:hypothetical protein